MNTEKKSGSDNLKDGARGGAVAFALRIASTGLGFLNQIALARILGAGGTGEVILALSVISIAVLISSFGMQGAMVRFIPYYLARDESQKLKAIVLFALKFCLAISIGAMLLIIVLSKYLSLDIFHEPGLIKLLPVVAVVLPLSVFNEVTSGVLRGFKDIFKSLLPRPVISPLLRLLVFLIMTISMPTPLSGVIAFAVGELVAALISIRFLLFRTREVRPLYDRHENIELLKVAATMIFTGVSVFLYTQADLWIVGMFRNTEEVGIYGVVSRLVTLIAFSLGAFSTIISPIMSSLYTARKNDELKEVVSESTRWILSLSVPITLFFVLEGDYILQFLYGKHFSSGYISLVILSVGQLFASGAGLVGWLLQMTGSHRVFMNISIAWGIINVVLNIILVPRYGMNGAAVSTAICLAMAKINSAWIIFRKMSVITFARGMLFDTIFLASVALCYLILKSHGIDTGIHALTAGAILIYLWKSLASGDIPIRYLFPKSKT
jgi:O-antigen/teichoic acid export membrane protein